MSGYRHSGLTEQDFADREALLRAAGLIAARWSDENGASRVVLFLRELAERIEATDAN